MTINICPPPRKWNRIEKIVVFSCIDDKMGLVHNLFNNICNNLAYIVSAE
jgi:hypothetical protein